MLLFSNYFILVYFIYMFFGLPINWQLEGNFVNSLVISMIMVVMGSLTMSLMMLQLKFSYMFTVTIVMNYLVLLYMHYNMYMLLSQKSFLKLLVKKEFFFIDIMVFMLLAVVMFLYMGLFLLNVNILKIPGIYFLEGPFKMVKNFLLLLTMMGIMKTLFGITQMF